MSPTARSVSLNLLLLGASLVMLFVVGEGLCRLLLPDTQLRYVTHHEAMYHFAPNQLGTLVLASGHAAPAARINRLGFRGDDPAPGRPHFLVLGDSFTFGSGVTDDETFAARLDQWLGGSADVVNGGQPGYGIFQMQATLRRVAEDLRPSLVIVVIWQGDFLRQPPDDTERARFVRRQRLSELLKRSVLGTQLYRRLERLLIRAGQDRLVFRVGEGGAPPQADPKVIREAHLNGLRADAPRLVAMHDEARRYGHGLLLVLWPREDYAALRTEEHGLADALTTAIEALARQHAIPFVSVQSAMRRISAKEQLLIANDGHPTPLAHCIVAARIADELGRLNLAPPHAVPACDTAPRRASPLG
jgi:GDSL-like Lipase/Acylhydrolase family